MSTNNLALLGVIQSYNGLVSIHFGSEEAFNSFAEIRPMAHELFPRVTFVEVMSGWSRTSFDDVVREASVAHQQKHQQYGQPNVLHIGVLSDGASLDEIMRLSRQAADHGISLTPYYVFDLVEGEMILPKAAYMVMEAGNQKRQRMKEEAARNVATDIVNLLADAVGHARDLLGNEIEEPYEAAPAPNSLPRAVAPAGSPIRYVFDFWVKPGAEQVYTSWLADPAVKQVMMEQGIMTTVISEDADGHLMRSVEAHLGHQAFGVILYPDRNGLVKDGTESPADREKMNQLGYHDERLVSGTIADLSYFMNELIRHNAPPDEDHEEGSSIFYRSPSSSSWSSATHIAAAKMPDTASQLYNARADLNSQTQSKFQVFVKAYGPENINMAQDVVSATTSDKFEVYVLSRDRSVTEEEDGVMSRFFLVVDEFGLAEQDHAKLIEKGVPEAFISQGDFAYLKKYLNNLAALTINDIV